MKSKTTRVYQAEMNYSVLKASLKCHNSKVFEQEPGEGHQVCYMKLRSRTITRSVHCYRKEITGRYCSKTAVKSAPLPAEVVNYRTPVNPPKCHMRSVECSAEVKVPRYAVATNKGYSPPTPLCTLRSDYENQYFTFKNSEGDIEESFKNQEKGYSLLSQWCAYLSGYKDQFVTFKDSEGDTEIHIEECFKNQEKDKVLLRLYSHDSSLDETDGVVPKLVVSLSPSKRKDLLVRANNEELSVELQKYENSLPDEACFLLHWKPPHTTAQFECKSNPGVFIGVKDNQLALIQVGNQTDGQNRENILFNLSDD